AQATSGLLAVTAKRLSRSAAARAIAGNTASVLMRAIPAARSIAGMRTQRSGGASIEVPLGRRVRPCLTLAHLPRTGGGHERVASHLRLSACGALSRARRLAGRPGGGGGRPEPPPP